MKKLGVTFSILAGLLLLASCGAGGGFSFSSYFKKGLSDKKMEGSVVAKIDGVPLYLQEVRDDMRYSLGFEYSTTDVERLLSDPAVQANYEEKLVNQYLVMRKLLSDNTTNSEDFEKYMWMSLREAAAKYYLYQEFFKNKDNETWKSVLITTEAEVLAFYQENKSFFDEKGVNRQDALVAIRADIERRKQQLFLLELTEFQSKLMQDLKSQIKVEKTGY